MSKTVWLKYSLAVAIALIGAWLAVRAAWPRAHVHGGTPQPEHEDWHIGSDVSNAINGVLDPTDPSKQVFILGGRAVPASSFVTPTHETLDNIVNDAVVSVRKALAELTSDVALQEQERLQDLLSLFGERLRFTLDIDGEAYVESLLARGWMQPEESKEKPALSYRYFEDLGERYRMAALAPDEAVVRPRYLNGKLVARTDPGPRATWSAQGAYSLPDDPRTGKLDVYEVQIPIYAPTFRLEHVSHAYAGEGPSVPAMLGLAMAWDVNLHQWVVYRVHLYGQGNDENFFQPLVP